MDGRGRKMIHLPPGPFVIADLEYTSWAGALTRRWSGPGEFRETVQIGAVSVSRERGRLVETGAFSVLVRPALNPVLSDYFVDLTGISNTVVSQDGVTLEAALGAFAEFAGRDPVLTHGRDDVVIAEECAKKALDNPLAAVEWCNIAPPIREITGVELSSSDLPAHFGLGMDGRAHDALADSRALLRVLGYLEARAKG